MNFKPLAIAITSLFLIILFAITSCSSQSDRLFTTSDPIVTVGHGAFIGPNGKEIIPNREFIGSTQKHYIVDILLKNERASQGKNHLSVDSIQKNRELIYNSVEDTILARSLFIDWLIEKIQPDNIAHLTTVNNSLRWYYVNNLQVNRVQIAENQWAKGARARRARYPD